MDTTPLIDFGYISIHAPREGCDFTGMSRIQVTEDFNPRTP